MSSGWHRIPDGSALVRTPGDVGSMSAGQDAQQLRTAARQFESLFTQMMLKSMRAAGEGFKDSAFSSSQGDFYQDMFDQQLAQHLSRGRGLGLAEVLIEQLGRGRLTSDEVTEGRAPANRLEEVAAGSNAGGYRPRLLLSDAGTDGPSLMDATNTAMTHAARSVNRVSNGDAAQADVTRHTNEADTPAQFVAQMWPHAQRVAATLGVDAHVVLAQAALETGWGRHVPQAGVHSSHNLFGIKAGASWQGAIARSATLEYESGTAVRRQQSFRSYVSVADSFRDYAAVLSGPRYAGAVAAGGDVDAFARGLQQAGYATDPQYARKLIVLTEQLRAMTAAQTVGAASTVQPAGSSVDASSSRPGLVAEQATLAPLPVSEDELQRWSAALKSAAATPLSTDGMDRMSAPLATLALQGAR